MELDLSPLHSFKEQFTFAPNVVNDIPHQKYTRIIICGMGGSLISVSLLKMLYPELPITAHNSYGLPHLNEHDSTLLIFNSYSGDTEEILDSFKQSSSKNCSRAILSCGGMLIEQAQETSTPYIQIPPNTLEPRFSIGYQLIGLLTLMGEENKIRELSTCIQNLNISEAERSGKSLAEKLAGTYPVIYSSSLFYPVAYLIKAAVNEGAKLPCFVNQIPEANHNELQSYVLDDTHNEHEHFSFLFITSTFDHQRILKRFMHMHDLYKERSFIVETLEKDSTSITEVFQVILTGYFMATYLAFNRGCDPYKTPFIKLFKESMKS